jgi:hypothetical protein
VRSVGDTAYRWGLRAGAGWTQSPMIDRDLQDLDAATSASYSSASLTARDND